MPLWILSFAIRENGIAKMKFVVVSVHHYSLPNYDDFRESPKCENVPLWCKKHTSPLSL